VDQSSRRRAVILHICFCALFFSLIVRLYGIQVVGHETYKAKSVLQSSGNRFVDLPPGAIYDSRGLPLAVSAPMKAVWANPEAIVDKPESAYQLLVGDAGPFFLDGRTIIGRYGPNTHRLEKIEAALAAKR
jgi:cell division protein FtsI/penicillin-binding protein 2